MNLTQAIDVARRLMVEHGGIDIEIVLMRPRAVPVNPDNPEQIECAHAYNALSGVALLMDERRGESPSPQERIDGQTRGAL